MWIKRFLAFHEMMRDSAKKGLGRDGQAGKSAPQGSDGSVRLASPCYASTFKAGEWIGNECMEGNEGGVSCGVGVAGVFGCFYDDDLFPCDESAGSCSARMKRRGRRVGFASLCVYVQSGRMDWQRMYVKQRKGFFLYFIQ